MQNMKNFKIEFNCLKRICFTFEKVFVRLIISHLEIYENCIMIKSQLNINGNMEFVNNAFPLVEIKEISISNYSEYSSEKVIFSMESE